MAVLLTVFILRLGLWVAYRAPDSVKHLNQYDEKQSGEAECNLQYAYTQHGEKVEGEYHQRHWRGQEYGTYDHGPPFAFTPHREE